MKDFLKTFLAVVLGIITVEIIGIALFFGIVGSLASLFSVGEPELKNGSVLFIDMAQTEIVERTQDEMEFSSFSLISPYTTLQTENIGILDARLALDAAAQDPDISMVYLKSDPGMTPISLSLAEELAAGLKQFRKSGKPVICYMEHPSNMSMYLASVADKVYMDPGKGCTNEFIGINMSLTFLGDLLDRLGINMQLIRHGKYKSAGETFTKGNISEENRIQYEALVDGLWKVIRKEVAKGRGVSEAKIDWLVDNLKLTNPEDFLKEGLVDGLLTMSEREDVLTALCGKESYNDLNLLTLRSYYKLTTQESEDSTIGKIAVLYLDGEIVDASDDYNICGARFQKEISDLRRDSLVKAVILRVNSPGGSVKAAEGIRREIVKLAKVKPVIASYSSYAASGGYWISAQSKRIFSDASTLTGSIGVFSLIPEVGNALRKNLLIRIVNIPSNEHSDMYSITRPLDKEETEYLQKDVNDIYDLFTGIVSKGRHMSKDKVDAIAQGRVWSGNDAKAISLVDEIGGLYEALDYTYDLCYELYSTSLDKSNFKVEEYPAPISWYDDIFSAFSTSEDEASIFKGTKLEATERALRQISTSEPTVYARLPYLIDVR